MAVPSEITVNLNRKNNHSDNQLQCSHLPEICEYIICSYRRRLRNNKFLKKTEHHKNKTALGFFRIKTVYLIKLMQQITATLNRSCHKLREKADKQSIFEQIFFAFHITAIYIKRITECLKYVKTDTDRKHEIKSRKSNRNPNFFKYDTYTFNCKIVIFKEKQNA